ncbi:hypothetical protein DMH04_52300 [Kibdelosporangium aridum]|uniref:Uncharacterized protein n=1 Tax=Kibdelosporangium aridum TaxID=2030 RepID=A0A428Y8E3_KIBAR|nr:hypothetical protein DMH04_52300 [Kibdelosporangium aridum]
MIGRGRRPRSGRVVTDRRPSQHGRFATTYLEQRNGRHNEIYWSQFVSRSPTVDQTLNSDNPVGAETPSVLVTPPGGTGGGCRQSPFRVGGR